MDGPQHTALSRATQRAAALIALGIAYGDLGISPLYTLQTIVGTLGGKFGFTGANSKRLIHLWAVGQTLSAAEQSFGMVGILNF
jgi:KUP system potassium uptake protein